MQRCHNVFPHVLNHRHHSIRIIPRNIPASVRATFNQEEIDYGVSRTKVGRGQEDNIPLRKSCDRDDWDATSTSSRKDDFAAGYLSSLGEGESSTKYNSTGVPHITTTNSGTDFSSVKDEKVRLQRELALLSEKIDAAEAAESRSQRLGRGKDASSKSALSRRSWIRCWDSSDAS
jgi:actin cytoskeleton-regulatory complex protein END3